MFAKIYENNKIWLVNFEKRCGFEKNVSKMKITCVSVIDLHINEPKIRQFAK